MRFLAIFVEFSALTTFAARNLQFQFRAAMRMEKSAPVAGNFQRDMLGWHGRLFNSARLLIDFMKPALPPVFAYPKTGFDLQR